MELLIRRFDMMDSFKKKVKVSFFVFFQFQKIKLGGKWLRGGVKAQERGMDGSCYFRRWGGEFIVLGICVFLECVFYFKYLEKMQRYYSGFQQLKVRRCDLENMFFYLFFLQREVGVLCECGVCGVQRLREVK